MLSQYTVLRFVLGPLDRRLGGHVLGEMFLYTYDSGSQLAFCRALVLSRSYMNLAAIKFSHSVLLGTSFLSREINSIKPCLVLFSKQKFFFLKC